MNPSLGSVCNRAWDTIASLKNTRCSVVSVTGKSMVYNHCIPSGIMDRIVGSDKMGLIQSRLRIVGSEIELQHSDAHEALLCTFGTTFIPRADRLSWSMVLCFSTWQRHGVTVRNHYFIKRCDVRAYRRGLLYRYPRCPQRRTCY